MTGHSGAAGDSSGECTRVAGDSSDIAIVGMACRMPGAGNISELWRVLRDGVNAVECVPQERRLGVQYAGLIENGDAFDAGFFGISPREAAGMDPQQGLALELIWEGLEDAGIVLRQHRRPLPVG